MTYVEGIVLILCTSSIMTNMFFVVYLLKGIRNKLDKASTPYAETFGWQYDPEETASHQTDT